MGQPSLSARGHAFITMEGTLLPVAPLTLPLGPAVGSMPNDRPDGRAWLVLSASPGLSIDWER